MQIEQHSMIAQSVGLHPLQAQELGHTFVIRLKQLLVYVVIHRGLVDFIESVLDKEVDHKREAEQSPDTQVPCSLDQFSDDHRADTGTHMRPSNSDGSKLCQVLPHDVQRTTAHHLAVDFDDNELLDVLENRHGGLGKEVTVTGILVDQTTDSANVRRSSRADAGIVHLRSGLTSGNKMVSRIP